MNILIAPDSFKGSITSVEYCDIAESKIKERIPDSNIIKCPLADGGEGTVESLIYNTKGTIFNLWVTGPLGTPVEAFYGILGDGRTAVIEMASASGLPLVPEESKNPMITTTFGTGELVKDALDKGCNRIVLGIGGSATNDGGAGMMQALGYQLLDNDKKTISRGGEGLLKLKFIDTSTRDKRLDEVEFLVACDVNNPLCGPDGASYVYGPQKGATKDQISILDKALSHYADIIQKEFKKEVKNIPGAGAAGGLGAGLIAFFDATLKPGFHIIANMIGLESIISNGDLDLIITGEGEINYQTVNGKLPYGVAKVAKKYNVPVIAIVGTIGEGADKVYNYGIHSIYSIVKGPCSLDYALDHAKELLADTIDRVMRTIKINI